MHLQVVEVEEEPDQPLELRDEEEEAGEGVGLEEDDGEERGESGEQGASGMAAEPMRQAAEQPAARAAAGAQRGRQASGTAPGQQQRAATDGVAAQEQRAGAGSKKKKRRRLGQERAGAAATGKAAEPAEPRQQQEQHRQQGQQERSPRPDQQAPGGNEQQQLLGGQWPAAQAPIAPSATPAPASAPTLAPGLLEVVTRTQILVPVSSGYAGITPELLQRLFCIRGVAAQQLLLALVDSHGVVTRNCLYNYIQVVLVVLVAVCGLCRGEVLRRRQRHGLVGWEQSVATATTCTLVFKWVCSWPSAGRGVVSSREGR